VPHLKGRLHAVASFFNRTTPSRRIVFANIDRDTGPRVCASPSTQGHAHIARGHHRRQPSTSTNFTTSSSPPNLMVNVNANKIFFFSY
jgi:hypothetical protein